MEEIEIAKDVMNVGEMVILLNTVQKKEVMMIETEEEEVKDLKEGMEEADLSVKTATIAIDQVFLKINKIFRTHSQRLPRPT